ncbi:MAG: nucleotidyltransferase family protein [Candidatus Aminicenantes bacterium]|nr:nucleotidyltransferase family protein [Candidatus Aminicenantes bacterium]
MTKAITCQHLLRLLKQAFQEIQKFGVKRIGLFGSCVREEAGHGSDIDVLVEFSQPSFDNYMELKFFLEALFGREVDLVLADSLKEQIKPDVMREVVYAEGS